MSDISRKGVRFIARHEGWSPTAYRDSGGVLTIGYGHTGPDVKPGQKINKRKGRRLLRRDLAVAVDAVNENVRVRLTQGRLDCLVSFAFNVGVNAFQSSTLLKRLNAGDHGAVPSELRRWVNVGGVRVEGLVNRRRSEARLWRSGRY